MQRATAVSSPPGTTITTRAEDSFLVPMQNNTLFEAISSLWGIFKYTLSEPVSKALPAEHSFHTISFLLSLKSNSWEFGDTAWEEIYWNHPTSFLAFSKASLGFHPSYSTQSWPWTRSLKTATPLSWQSALSYPSTWKLGRESTNPAKRRVLIRRGKRWKCFCWWLRSTKGWTQVWRKTRHTLGVRNGRTT